MVHLLWRWPCLAIFCCDHGAPFNLASIPRAQAASAHALIARGLRLVAFEAFPLAHFASCPTLRPLRLFHCVCCHDCCRHDCGRVLSWQGSDAITSCGSQCGQSPGHHVERWSGVRGRVHRLGPYHKPCPNVPERCTLSLLIARCLSRPPTSACTKGSRRGKLRC